MRIGSGSATDEDVGEDAIAGSGSGGSGCLRGRPRLRGAGESSVVSTSTGCVAEAVVITEVVDEFVFKVAVVDTVVRSFSGLPRLAGDFPVESLLWLMLLFRSLRNSARYFFRRSLHWRRSSSCPLAVASISSSSSTSFGNGVSGNGVLDPGRYHRSSLGIIVGAFSGGRVLGDLGMLEEGGRIGGGNGADVSEGKDG